MGFFSTLTASLKAVSEIADAIKLLDSTLKNIGDLRTEAKINNIKRELDEIIDKVKETEDRQKLLELAERLNSNRL